MANKNDGRIPGGPTTDLIIQQRQSHISSLIFAGKLYDYNDGERLREHVSWRYDSVLGYWKLSADQVALMKVFGFYYIDQIYFLQHDRDLIFSLVERWWPGRNTFQLPFGEMSIILVDVANILGLPITGEPIIFDESFSAKTAITEYLGVEVPRLYGKNFVTFTWLRHNFLHLDRIGDQVISVDDDRVIACTRAYLLALISAILFPDSSDKVDLRFLPFLVDLTEPTCHAWGAAVLAYLYSSMTDFVQFLDENKRKKNLNGCMTLIQVWSYEHFYIGRPVSRFNSDEAVFPSALRWTTDAKDTLHCEQPVVSLYRGQFDSLKYDEVTFVPHRLEQNPSEIQATAFEYSLHKFFIIFHGDIMYHPADRVLRQFWMKQHIPDEPPCLNRSRASAAVRARKLIPGWSSRFQTHSVALSEMMDDISDALGDIPYRVWWGAPLISNRSYQHEEFRFQHRAMDDSSLRDYYDGTSRMLPDLWQAYQNHPVTDPLSTAVKSFLDMAQTFSRSVPPNPPLHIPADYPQGHVSQRQARPRRNYTNVWHIDSPSQQDDEVPQQADEGTSQWPGQGTSQLPGEGTSQWHGEGTSQWPGSGTSQWPGEGTSQWHGEGTSQWPGEGTSQWPGEGTSQWAGQGTSQQVGEGTSQWDNIFSPGILNYTQITTTPSAPMPTQQQDTQGGAGDAAPENTRERRDRLNLRTIDRRDYWQLDRAGR